MCDVIQYLYTVTRSTRLWRDFCCAPTTTTWLTATLLSSRSGQFALLALTGRGLSTRRIRKIILDWSEHFMSSNRCVVLPSVPEAYYYKKLSCHIEAARCFVYHGYERHLCIARPQWKTTDKIATCPQLGSTKRLEHAQVRPGTHSFSAKSATLAGCCRPNSVQSLRPGVQMSAQDGSWIPVYLLPTRLRHLWPSPPPIGWPWSCRFPTCETCFIRRTFICIRRPFELELTSCLP